MDPKISFIVAIGKNREMGKHEGEDKNTGVGDVLPWEIPEDAKFYRDKTRWHVNVMGRKTFESLSAHFHGPPPKRVNIVITRDKDFDPTKFVQKYEEYWKEKKDSPLSTVERTSFAFTDAKEALDFAKKEELKLRKERQDGLEPEVMVVGGAQIFKLCMPFADRLYVTTIDGEFPDADAFFPDYSEFTKVVNERPSHDENYSYTFKTLKR